MRRCILVVDDDDVARKAAACSLQSIAGWEVLEAYCGEQGLEWAISRQPDAILLDVMMPGMDGPAMLGKLKTARSTAHIPVVLLTAKARAAATMSRLPVEAILTKPFDPRKLAQSIAAALGWTRDSKLPS